MTLSPLRHDHDSCIARRSLGIGGLACVVLIALLLPPTHLSAAAGKTELASLDRRVQARSALLVNAASGEALFSRNPNEPLPPASTVKLLTALLVYERTQLRGEVVVQRADTMVVPSRIPL